MAQVTLTNVRKLYDQTEAVHDFTLDIADGEFVVLFGQLAAVLAVGAFVADNIIQPILNRRRNK